MTTPMNPARHAPTKEAIAQNGQPIGARQITDRKLNPGLKPQSFKKP